MTLLDADPEDVRQLLEYASADERETLLLGIELAMLEDDPPAWLRRVFPDLFPADFAPHHLDFWRWLFAVRAGERCESFIGIWGRGGAKSASVEAGVVVLGIRRARNYGLYVCETQDQADDHVSSIGTILEGPTISRLYPSLGDRMVGKFGAVKGWRRNRLRTRAGFTIDALGLDSAARGVKLDDARPDLLILDDIDSDKDGPGQVLKKVDSITRKLIPAGSSDLIVIGIQNLVHQESVFAKLAGIATEPAEFLMRRQVSGPIPALYGAAFNPREEGGYDIVAGEPSWVGQNLETCRAMVDDMGLTAFRVECQHETDARGGGMFDHLDFRHVSPDAVPPLRVTEVWCDPAVTNTDDSDSMAVQAGGLAADGTIYMLRSWESRATPEDALKIAIAWAIILGAIRVGVETDQGGDTWQTVFAVALQGVRADWRKHEAGEHVDGRVEYRRALAEIDTWPAIEPHFDEAKAGSTAQSKAARAQMMVPDYENGRIVHVTGSHSLLEAGLRRFPRRKPFDLVDATYWTWRALRRLGMGAKSSARKNAATTLPPVPTSFGVGAPVRRF